jgi:hypothetical protein
MYTTFSFSLNFKFTQITPSIIILPICTKNQNQLPETDATPRVSTPTLLLTISVFSVETNLSAIYALLLGEK